MQYIFNKLRFFVRTYIIRTFLVEDHRTIENDNNSPLESTNCTCTCSYCVGNYKIKYGLNIPISWNSPTSWYVIKYANKRYIRATLPIVKYINLSNVLIITYLLRFIFR